MAFCHAIRCVKFGPNFDHDEPVKVTQHQLAWFLYFLQLAMDGDKNMKMYNDAKNKSEIKYCKRYIRTHRARITHIHVVFKEDMDLQEVLREDVEDVRSDEDENERQTDDY